MHTERFWSHGQEIENFGIGARTQSFGFGFRTLGEVWDKIRALTGPAPGCCPQMAQKLLKAIGSGREILCKDGPAKASPPKLFMVAFRQTPS